MTAYNRNFPMRNDGPAATMNLIGSPEIVTALALAGRVSFNPLTDTLTGADGQSPRLEPPGAAPDVPRPGFALDRSACVAPPVDGWGTGPGQGEPNVDAKFDVRLTPACDNGGVEHESNLKKQGDRLSLVGLGGLTPGVDVAAILRHADGSRAGLRLRHSYTAARIAWFTHGSALNIFQH